MVSEKGKDKDKVTDDGGEGKRQSRGGGADDDKTGPKRKNRGGVQIFDDMDEDSSDDSSFDGYDFEEMSLQEDVGKIFEGLESKIWKVKCTDGLERISAIMLMQKYVDLGAKFPIFSACSINHVKGSIFVEAEKLTDVYEACRRLPYFYLSSVNKSIGISRSTLCHADKFKTYLAQIISTQHWWAAILPSRFQQLYGEKKLRFLSYERPEDHGVAEHLITMLCMWRKIEGKVEGVVTDYAAVRKTIETIPDDWRVRAEQLYNKQVVYTSTADVPILNYQKYVADMLYWWASGRIRGEGEENAMGVL